MNDFAHQLPLDVLLIVHAAATWFMAGVIWIIQTVHYPLLAKVGLAGWRDYENEHCRRITFVVLPTMFVELASATLLVLTSIERASPSLPMALGGAALVLAIWISTFAVQVPLHDRLREDFNPVAHARLVKSNWLRTLAWSVRAGLAALMLVGP